MFITHSQQKFFQNGICCHWFSMFNFYLIKLLSLIITVSKIHKTCKRNVKESRIYQYWKETWTFQENSYSDIKQLKHLLIVIIWMVKVVILDATFLYNSLFDFLEIIERFPSSSALDLFSIVNRLSLQIYDSSRGIIMDYGFSFQRSCIYDKWQRLWLLTHSVGAVLNEEYNSFVIHSHLFLLENVDKVEKRRKFSRSGEIGRKSSKSAPEIRRILIRRKAKTSGELATLYVIFCVPCV